jgi:hypothetical protein
MRNNLAVKQQYGSAFGGGTERADATSADQLGAVWNGAKEIVAASPMLNRASGTYDLDLARYPSEFNLSAALNVRRANQLGLPPLSPRTIFSSSIPDFSERTRILALDGEKLAMRDDELAEWLVEAEKNIFLGTDNHPLFETSLEDTACTITRLPNGQVAMTEVPRQHVEASRERMRSLIGDAGSAHLNLTIETPLRCAARYFLAGLPDGNALLRLGKDAEVTAFLLIGRSGYSYGLWSPFAGLFNEYAFIAPKDLAQTWAGRDAKRAGIDTSPGAKVPNAGNGGDDMVNAYIRQAFDQLFLQLTPEKIEQLQSKSDAQVIWATEAGLADLVSPIAAEYSQASGLDCHQLPVPSDEAVASGLLFGSFTFGEATAAGAEILPRVNLARDLLALADSEEVQRRHFEEIQARKRRNTAVFTLFAAPVIVAAFILAMMATLVREQLTYAFRDSRAEARTQELKPALDRRKSYEANLKWYQEFVTQVSGLRKQQPVGIGLLYQLNSNYPFAMDPSFYVSDLKLSPAGEVEMKGLARNKDAIASFLKSLEFAGGTASGSRLFSNLAYEVQENAPVTAAGITRPGVPAMSGSMLTAANTIPGTVAWSMKGTFTPMVEFAPAKPAAPGAPAPAPAATAKPAS